MNALRGLGAAAACALLTHCASVPGPEVLAEQRAQVQAARESGQEGYQRGRDIVRDATSSKQDDFLALHMAVEEAVSAQPLWPRNSVRLLTDGPATYKAMQQAIRAARHSIRLETYIFDDDEIGNLFADLLIERARAGLDVALMVDAIGTLAASEEMFARMRDAGVQVVVFNPLNPLAARAGWSVNERSHRKILVTDGRVGFLGGINVSGVYASSSLLGKRDSQEAKGADDAPWRDTHVEIRGPAVQRIEEVFLEGWNEQKGPPIAQRQTLGAASAAGDLTVRILANQPGEEDGYTVYLTLMSALQSAQKRIWITMAYFVPDPAFVQALQEASQRGVDVRLILPGFTDSKLVFHAGRSHYTSLLKSGVQLYERKDALLHAKTIVIDGVWSTVGSSNLDWRSFALNHEINAVILGTSFAREMEMLFEQDQQAAERVTLEQWRSRAAGDRLMEGFSRLFERWL